MLSPQLDRSPRSMCFLLRLTGSSSRLPEYVSESFSCQPSVSLLHALKGTDYEIVQASASYCEEPIQSETRTAVTKDDQQPRTQRNSIPEILLLTSTDATIDLEPRRRARKVRVFRVLSDGIELVPTWLRLSHRQRDSRTKAAYRRLRSRLGKGRL